MQQIVANLTNLKSLDLRDNCFIDEHRLRNKILRASPSLEQFNNESVKFGINEIERSKKCNHKGPLVKAFLKLNICHFPQMTTLATI